MEKANILDAIPCRKPHVITEREGECVVIAYPRFKRIWMNRFLPRNLSPYIRVHLEVHGSAVWESIDGQLTVRGIMEKLARHFEGEVGYDTRIITYLYQLEKDGFIDFYMIG